jgi:hypothetical protein
MGSTGAPSRVIAKESNNYLIHNIIKRLHCTDADVGEAPLGTEPGLAYITF